MQFEIVTSQDIFYLNCGLDLARLSFEEQNKGRHKDSTRHRACVIGAITCSVSFLECEINGLYDYALRPSRKTKFHNALASVWSERFDRLPLLAKYQIALALARRDAFRTNSEPYQSAEVLVELRNAISHPKELFERNKRQKQLENRLRGKYMFNPKEEHREEFFPDRGLSSDCSIWAVIVSARFFLEFQRRLPPTAYMLSSRHTVSTILTQAEGIRPAARGEHPRERAT